MAATKNSIRALLAADHPVVYVNVDGIQTPYNEAEREAWLDEQVEIAFANEEGWIHLRSERNALLASTDWTQVADAPVDSKTWAEYRQALRDLPANTDDPNNPVWPTPPS